jgi:hypothetical protein
MVQDRNLDVLVFNGYSVSLQVIESYLIQNHGLKLKGWSNTITSNPEIRIALKELRKIYLDNIQVGLEAKLLFLTAISAVGYHNSNINMIIYKLNPVIPNNQKNKNIVCLKISFRINQKNEFK